MNASEEATNPTTATEPDGFREVITLDEGKVKSHLDQVVRDTVEQTLNALLDAEADALWGACGTSGRSSDSTLGLGRTAGPCTPPPAK